MRSGTPPLQEPAWVRTGCATSPWPPWKVSAIRPWANGTSGRAGLTTSAAG